MHRRATRESSEARSARWPRAWRPASGRSGRGSGRAGRRARRRCPAARAQAAAPVRPHHDQLGARRGRARDDLGVGAADQHRGLAAQAGGADAAPPRRAGRRSTRSITLLMSIGTVATSIGGGSANDASTATCTRSTVASGSLRERHRRRQRLRRRIGEVRRDQDAFDAAQVHDLKLATAGVRYNPEAASLDAPRRMRQEGAMPSQTVAARIRGFICLNAHPAGCAANVDAEIAVATSEAPPAAGWGRAGGRRQHRLRPVEPGDRRVRLRRARRPASAWSGRRRATRPHRPAGTTWPPPSAWRAPRGQRSLS